MLARLWAAAWAAVDRLMYRTTDTGAPWTPIGRAPADEPVATPQVTVLGVHGAPESETTSGQALVRPGRS